MILEEKTEASQKGDFFLLSKIAFKFDRKFLQLVGSPE